MCPEKKLSILSAAFCTVIAFYIARFYNFQELTEQNPKRYFMSLYVKVIQKRPAGARQKF